MLGKLLVHEWKDSWKLMAILNGAVLLLSVAGIVLNLFTDSVDMSTLFKSGGSQLSVMMYGSYMMLYVLSIFALSIGSAIYFYVRFYRNLYTDQGYLMHTLPVSEHSLILSKALIAAAWRIFGMIIMAVGIGSLVFSFMGKAFREEYLNFKDIYRAFDIDGINPFLALMYMVLMLLAAVGSVIFSVLQGYAAISIGQLASKNKVLASVGAYFGIQILLSIISNILTQSLMIVGMQMDFRWDLTDNFGPVFLIYLALMNVAIYGVSAGFYFITHAIMKNKLNLE